MAQNKVEIKCGPLENGYAGIAQPELDVVYLQTEEEAEKYSKEMKKLLKDGLPAEGATISGI